MFFFKQKTEYELRISDWSSDVCSSDLTGAGEQRQVLDRAASASLPSQALHRPQRRPPVEPERAEGVGVGQPGQRAHRQPAAEIHVRSEERRVGKEFVSNCRYRWSAYH